MTLLFAMLTVICAFGWFVQYVSCAALMWYLDKKGILPPSGSEMEEGCKWVVRNMINDLFGRKNMR